MEKKVLGLVHCCAYQLAHSQTASVLQLDAVDMWLLPTGDVDTISLELGPKIIKPYSPLGQGT